MRYLLGFICVCALGVMPLVGCGDNNDGGGSGGSAGSGGTGGSAGTAGTGGMAGGGGSGGSIAARIAFVRWTWVDPCDSNASGQGLVVEIYAAIGDRIATPEDQLSYSGQVQGCTGDLNAMETTLSCEVYLGARQGEAIVTDPQGHEETMFFAPESCTNDCEPSCPPGL